MKLPPAHRRPSRNSYLTAAALSLGLTLSSAPLALADDADQTVSSDADDSASTTTATTTTAQDLATPVAEVVAEEATGEPYKDYVDAETGADELD